MKRKAKNADPFPKIMARRLPGSDERVAVAPSEPATRAPAYLDFVRSFPCAQCQAAAPSEAHHWAPTGIKCMGRKVSDHYTLPLCRECHQRWHTTGSVLPRSEDLIDDGPRQSAELFMRAQLRTLIAWVRHSQTGFHNFTAMKDQEP